MNPRERSIIMLVVTLFLALILVYIIYFRVRDSRTDTPPPLNPSTESGSQFASSDFGGPEYVSGQQTKYVETINLTDNQSGASSLGRETNSFGGNSKLSTFTAAIAQLGNIGIKQRYSDISIARQLGLTAQVAFADKDNILYGYLGTGSLDALSSTVRRLGGSVLAIETRNDILSNHLRGDRVLFINIPGTTFVQQPTEQRLLVAMIVTIAEDRRFIQAPINQYYAHKDDMKLYFDRLYGRTL